MTRLVGDTDEVIDAFLAGVPMRTAKAQVPGGYRVVSVRESFEGADNITVLYSYRTQIAVRLPNGNVAITPEKYSVTTSRVVNKLRRMMCKKTDMTFPFRTNVPGRWGGFGPAWHTTGVETIEFEVYRA